MKLPKTLKNTFVAVAGTLILGTVSTPVNADGGYGPTPYGHPPVDTALGGVTTKEILILALIVYILGTIFILNGQTLRNKIGSK
jgi:hypothetical protein